jgi:hypothetical protein
MACPRHNTSRVYAWEAHNKRLPISEAQWFHDPGYKALIRFLGDSDAFPRNPVETPSLFLSAE